jgi:hypothetical protein
VERLQLDLNRAAEAAAVGAFGALASEIRALPLPDAQATPRAGPTAATDVLRGAAAEKLLGQLAPLVAKQRPTRVSASARISLPASL